MITIICVLLREIYILLSGLFSIITRVFSPFKSILFHPLIHLYHIYFKLILLCTFSMRDSLIATLRPHLYNIVLESYTK